MKYVRQGHLLELHALFLGVRSERSFLSMKNCNSPWDNSDVMKIACCVFLCSVQSSNAAVC